MGGLLDRLGRDLRATRFRFGVARGVAMLRLRLGAVRARFRALFAAALRLFPPKPAKSCLRVSFLRVLRRGLATLRIFRATGIQAPFYELLPIRLCGR